MMGDIFHQASSRPEPDLRKSTIEVMTEQVLAGARAILLGLLLGLSVVLASSSSLPVNAQNLRDQWRAATPAELEAFRYAFVGYDIEEFRNEVEILNMSSVTLFRIGSRYFCNGTLCFTLVVSNCGRLTCPSTSVFAKKDVEIVRDVTGLLGGAVFVRFPLATDRDITVIVARKFISTGRGVGEN